jgi:hypothetical protein
MKPNRTQIRRAAEAAHEVNRAICLAVDDASQVAWKDAPEWQKKSAIAGVRAIATNPKTTPRQSHEGWLELKRSEGWVYGEVKDAEKKTHPCMVDYDQLPAGQRVKDSLFGIVVRAVLGMRPVVVG